MRNVLFVIFILNGSSGFCGQDPLGQPLNTEIPGREMPHAPLSSCLESLKNLSLLPGWGTGTEGKTYIVPLNYTVDYSYNEKSKKYSPVLVVAEGEKTLVSTINGTTELEGRGCKVIGKTSEDVISSWIDKSFNNFESAKKFNPDAVMKMSAKAKENFLNSSKAAEAKYKSILTSCANESLGKISESASAVLSKLSTAASHSKKAAPSNGVQ